MIIEDLNKMSDVGAALAYADATDLSETIDVSPFGGTEEIIVTRNGHATTLTPARDLLAKYAPAPDRRKGTIETHSLASFVDLVNRDKRPDSVIFADVESKRVTAVLDFHGAADSAPRFGEDRVTYGFRYSVQFSAWLKVNSVALDQKSFARLIDDRLGDIGEGDLAAGSVAAEFARRRGFRFANISDLVVFTRTIAAKSATSNKEIVDEKTGDVSIQYSKKNDVETPEGTPVPVPSAFFLTIPILNGIGATQYNIAARLRYDIGERGIMWRIELHALDTYIQSAIEDAVAVVRRAVDDKADAEGKPHQHGCGLPVYLASAPGQ